MISYEITATVHREGILVTAVVAVKFKALVRNIFIIINVFYIQAIAKWVDKKLIKTISFTKLTLSLYFSVPATSRAENRVKKITSSEESIMFP